MEFVTTPSPEQNIISHWTIKFESVVEMKKTLIVFCKIFSDESFTIQTIPQKSHHE